MHVIPTGFLGGPNSSHGSHTSTSITKTMHKPTFQRCFDRQWPRNEFQFANMYFKTNSDGFKNVRFYGGDFTACINIYTLMMGLGRLNKQA